jgi:hypothetical protein
MTDNSIMPEPTAAASPGAFTEPLRPPRKRRRPALSCVQCRRRKVKCDREMPCTQCTQYSNTVCAYNEPEVQVQAKGATSPALRNNPSTLVPSQSHGIPTSRESILFNTPRTTDPQVTETRSLTASFACGTASQGGYPRPEQVSESLVGAGTPQSETIVQELKDRVRKLEAIVSRSINYAQHPPEHDSYISTTNIPKLRGNIDKSRFFGVSHWMNNFDEV